MKGNTDCYKKMRFFSLKIMFLALVFCHKRVYNTSLERKGKLSNQEESNL